MSENTVHIPLGRSRALAALSEYPYNILTKEAGSDKNLTNFKNGLIGIQENYINYEKGVLFAPSKMSSDYVPSLLKYKNASVLINKEARFMFSQTPDINIIGAEGDSEQIEAYKKIVAKMIKDSNFSKHLLQAAKDYAIGGRVACLVDMSRKKGLRLHFYNALQFYYERDYDGEELSLFVSMENITERLRTKQTLYLVNRYQLIDEVVYMSSIIYTAGGVMDREVTPWHSTDLKGIPAVVITNNGVLENKEGTSEIEELTELEAAFSKLANAEIDADEKGMYPVTYVVDMNTRTTKNLPTGPGAFWEFKSDQEMENPKSLVGQIAPSMTHTEPVKATLERIKGTMYNLLDVPDISQSGLLSGITSFKALKALYFPLTVRCNEKMRDWKPALEYIFRKAIELAILNGTVTKTLYIVPSLKQVEYEIEVVENYALLEDEEEEKALDMQEIATSTRSVYSYLKKWRVEDLKTDEQIEQEIMRIATEKNMFDTMSMNSLVQDTIDSVATDVKVEEGKETEEAIEGTEFESDLENAKG